jgi:hypothetical protein
MATIKAYTTAGGKRYRVRYRKPGGAQTDKRDFTTKRDAELYLANVEVKKSTGDYVDPARGKITIGELGAKWLASRNHLKPSSKAAYESAWRIHVNPVWGDEAVASVEFSDVQFWLTAMSKGDDEHKAKSPTIVRRSTTSWPAFSTTR